MTSAAVRVNGWVDDYSRSTVKQVVMSLWQGWGYPWNFLFVILSLKSINAWRQNIMPTKKEVKGSLYKRDGNTCHYCGIPEKEFLGLWGKFYGLPFRGNTLEVDHKDSVVIQGNEIIKSSPPNSIENCVLACALCNMAKSDMFTHEEFHKVGKVIEEIWLTRRKAGLR